MLAGGPPMGDPGDAARGRKTDPGATRDRV
jgi:hypothetical protein